MKRKRMLILTSVVILLPILVGLVLWNQLPERMTTHWGVDGTANGWSGKAFAVFGLPLILLAIHWFCVLLTARDPGNRNQNPKVTGMVLWIVPILSLYTGGMIYGTVLGAEFSVERFVPLLMGILFLGIGNYMPKCRQNRTVGIRIKWTLESEENWNATHRVAGKLWVMAGLIFLLSVFLPGAGSLWVTTAGLPAVVLIPVVYSCIFHRKHRTAETASSAAESKKTAGKAGVTAAVILTVLAVTGSALLCCSGKIEVVYGETSFTMKASYYQDLTVEYEVVDSVELCEPVPAGQRRFGFGSPRLSMGQFRNEAYGDYTRYAYTRCDTAVVLRVGEEILVISGPDAERTQIIFQELAERCK